MVNHIYIKWKSDPKVVKKRVITRYGNKLTAHNSVRFDKWVVLQKLNPSVNDEADVIIDSCRKKRFAKTSGGILSMKIFNGYVGKVAEKVTSNLSYRQLKRKLMDIVKMLRFQNALLKDFRDHSSIEKDTWKSYKYLLDPYLRLDVLSKAFLYGRYSDKIYDIGKFGMKNCLTLTSLGWKLTVFLGQDEIIYTYNHRYSRPLMREACYGGRVATNIQDFKWSICTEYLAILQNLLKSNS